MIKIFMGPAVDLLATSLRRTLVLFNQYSAIAKGVITACHFYPEFEKISRLLHNFKVAFQFPVSYFLGKLFPFPFSCSYKMISKFCSK